VSTLRVTGLSKTFAGTRALIDVDLEVRHGEIHALVGGNGSGKSTLVKVLAGVYQADPGGTIEVDSVVADARDWSPGKAFEHGLRFVHQNPAVFGDLTVAENLAVGNRFPTGFGGRIRWKTLDAHARTLIERYHIPATPRTRLRALNPASRTMVAVARALADQDRECVLLLDEPTTSLPAGEVDLLLEALRRCAIGGQTILYISHRLDEVLALADRVTVLRDGERVVTASTGGTGDLTEARLVEHIAGRPVALTTAAAPPDLSAADEVLRVLDVHGQPLRGVELTVRRGEIVGIAGLLGSGRTELLQTIFGARRYASGAIEVAGKPVRFRSPADAMPAGIAYVPEDRGTQAVFASMTVRENISAGAVARYFKRLRLQHGWERREAQDAMRGFLVRATSDRAPMTTLSGGNQQKVVLARWIRRRPSVLLLDEPTQGVDVAAREEIYALIRQAAADGAGVLLVANDFTELRRLCHRVLVLRGGRITAELTGADLDSHKMTELAHLSRPGGHRD
jgi:ribose transport system ATP-binding protein